MLLVEETRGWWEVITALGPVFSSQVWSTIWLAMFWPRKNAETGAKRWTISGKKPNKAENRCMCRLGIGLYCLLVSRASSIATSRPIIVTARAASLRRGGMDMTGVFRGVILEVISRPAMMLPHASRLRGLISAGLFSLIGERGLNRGCPIGTKKTTRKL